MGSSVRCCVGKPNADDGDIADLTEKKALDLKDDSIHTSTKSLET